MAAKGSRSRHRPQPDDGRPGDSPCRRRRALGQVDPQRRLSRLPAWRSSTFRRDWRQRRARRRLPRSLSDPVRSLKQAGPFQSRAATPISVVHVQGLIFGYIADELYRRGKNCPRYADRTGGRPVVSLGAAWRHRPVARRQDGFHLLAGAQSRPWRSLAAVRGAKVRAHRPRLPGTAARRCGAALPVRGPHQVPGRGSRMAGFDARHIRTAPDDRIRIGLRLVAPVLARPLVDRYRRLSRRMAARPAAARQELR